MLRRFFPGSYYSLILLYSEMNQLINFLLLEIEDWLLKYRYRFRETLIDHLCVGRLVKLVNARWSISLLSFFAAFLLFSLLCFAIQLHFVCRHPKLLVIPANRNCSKSVSIFHSIQSIKILLNSQSRD